METVWARRFYLLGILLVFLVAAVVRLRFLGATSFWFDEIFTANLVTFRTSLTDVIDAVAKTDAHPPGHYLLSWFWAQFVGVWGSAFPEPTLGVEVRLRLLSVVTGLTSIAVVVGSWRRWLGNWPALATGLWIALSPTIVAQDREARMYPLLTLFLVLTISVLAHLIESNKRRHAVALGLLLAGSLYVHYLALFVLGGVTLGLIVTTQRHTILNRIIAIGIPCVAFLPWVPVLIEQLKIGRANVGIRGSAEGTFGLAFWEVVTVGEFVESTIFKFGVFPLFWILLTIGALAGVRFLRSGPESRGHGSLAAALTIGGLWAFFLWYVSSITILNTSSLRYLGVFVPSLLGLVVIGAKTLMTCVNTQLSIRLSNVVFSAALVFFISLSALGIGSGRLGSSEPWREVTEFLKSRVAEGDTVLVNEYGRLMSLAYYYRPNVEVELYIPSTPEDFTHLSNLSRVWVVVKVFGTPFLLQNEGGIALDSFLNERTNTVIEFGGNVAVVSSRQGKAN